MINPAKSKRISGPEAVAMTRKNLKSAAWFSAAGIVVFVGHALGARAVGAHGWLQYLVIGATAYAALFHLRLAWYFSRQLKTLQEGDEVIYVTPLPDGSAKTPWLVDVVAVSLLSLVVILFIGFPFLFVLGSYVWWGKLLALLFSAGMGLLLIFAWKKLFADRAAQIRFLETLWHLKALAVVPQLQNYIAQENSVSELWITLSYFFEHAYEPETRDDRLVRDIYTFAEWCLLSCDQEMGEDEAKELREGAVAFCESAANSPFGGADSINYVSQAVRGEFARTSFDPASQR